MASASAADASSPWCARAGRELFAHRLATDSGTSSARRLSLSMSPPGGVVAHVQRSDARRAPAQNKKSNTAAFASSVADGDGRCAHRARRAAPPSAWPPTSALRAPRRARAKKRCRSASVRVRAPRRGVRPRVQTQASRAVPRRARPTSAWRYWSSPQKSLRLVRFPLAPSRVRFESGPGLAVNAVPRQARNADELDERRGNVPGRCLLALSSSTRVPRGDVPTATPASRADRKPAVSSTSRKHTPACSTVYADHAPVSLDVRDAHVPEPRQPVRHVDPPQVHGCRAGDPCARHAAERTARDAGPPRPTKHATTARARRMALLRGGGDDRLDGVVGVAAILPAAVARPPARGATSARGAARACPRALAVHGGGQGGRGAGAGGRRTATLPATDRRIAAPSWPHLSTSSWRGVHAGCAEEHAARVAATARPAPPRRAPTRSTARHRDANARWAGSSTRAPRRSIEDTRARFRRPRGRRGISVSDFDDVDALERDANRRVRATTAPHDARAASRTKFSGECETAEPARRARRRCARCRG